MIKKLTLPIILIALAFFFWFSPNFKDIAAGVAILLFGMIALENGFKSLTEGPLERMLAKATNQFYKSFSLGMISTAILQSSSLVSVVTISFISTGLVSLTQGVGIIFGSNIGSTATAWLVATLGLKVKISAFAMPMLAFGIILVFQKSKSLKAIGNVLAGLGFLFLGIHFLKEGFDSYKDAIDLAAYAMTGFWGVVVFALLGLLITIILQSSAATMAIIITALAAGQVTYFNALALAIGANVGTTITAILGSLASNADGKRLAGAHLIFNIVTGFIALLFINQFAWVVSFLADAFNFAPENYTLKLVIFHTLFNVVGVLVMYPFVGKMVRFLNVRIKDEVPNYDEPLYLSKSSLAYPQTAMAALVKETNHLFDTVFMIVAHGLGLHRAEVLKKDVDEAPLRPLTNDEIDAYYYKKVKNIYGKILEFSARAQSQNTEASYIQSIYKIKEANRFFIDVLKDVKDIQPNILKYTASENDVMKNEYNKLRKKIAKILRQVYKAQNFEVPPNKSIEELTELALEHIETHQHKINKHLSKLKKDDILYNGTLNKLIMKKKITTEMSSSLINDSALTISITKHLLKAAELLYMDTDHLLTEVSDLENEED